MFFERLTDAEKRLIDLLRENAADNDRGDFFKGNFVDCKTWLRIWDNAKEELGEAFGDKLILRKPVTVTVEDDELHDAMSHVQWNTDWETVRDTIYEGLRDANSNFTHHIWGSRSMSMHNIVRNYLFSVDAFISNRYEYDPIEMKLPDGTVYKLAKGCKVMKAIGRLAKACGCEDRFENVRVKQSQILNEARLSSTLCLSIHPLDYMTASYNNNDWRSCMNWEDGEYRRGVIEMMNSECVVVAYLESKHETMRWGEMSWNSKKWREFFIVSPEVIMGIKGYPYWNRTLEDETLKWLRELYAPLYPNVTFSNTITTFETEGRARYINDDAMGVHDVHFSLNCGPAMYNDFYDGNEYHCIISTGLAESNDRGVLYIDYSGASECAVCGKYDVDFDGEGVLVCEECTEHHYCCSCGDPIFYSDDLFRLDDREYCERCFENLPRCSLCGDITDPNNVYGTLEFGTYIPYKNEDPNEDNAVLEACDNRWRRTARTICSCDHCSSKIFLAGYDETNMSHPYLYLDYQYSTMVPWSALTETGQGLFYDYEGEVEATMERVNNPDYKKRNENPTPEEKIFF